MVKTDHHITDHYFCYFSDKKWLASYNRRSEAITWVEGLLHQKPLLKGTSNVCVRERERCTQIESPLKSLLTFEKKIWPSGFKYFIPWIAWPIFWAYTFILHVYIFYLVVLYKKSRMSVNKQKNVMPTSVSFALSTHQVFMSEILPWYGGKHLHKCSQTKSAGIRVGQFH
jgi:hypothetical protein